MALFTYESALDLILVQFQVLIAFPLGNLRPVRVVFQVLGFHEALEQVMAHGIAHHVIGSQILQRIV